MNKREKTLKRKQKKEKQLKTDYKRRHNLSKYRQSKDVEFRNDVLSNVTDEEGSVVLDKDGNPKTEVVCGKIIRRKKKVGQPVKYPKSRKFKKPKKLN